MSLQPEENKHSSNQPGNLQLNEIHYTESANIGFPSVIQFVWQTERILREVQPTAETIRI